MMNKGSDQVGALVLLCRPDDREDKDDQRIGDYEAAKASIVGQELSAEQLYEYGWLLNP